MSVNPTASDLQIQELIEVETQKQRFQNFVHGLTEKCWDLCLPGKPSSRLDPKSEACLGSCVERFLDCNNFIVNRLEKTSKIDSSESISDF